MGSPAAIKVFAAFENAVSHAPLGFSYTLNPAAGPASGVARRMLRAVAKTADVELPVGAGAMAARGMMEFEPPRFMMDFGPYAMLGQDGKVWKGRPGRALTSSRGRPPPHGNPLWLMALAGGVTEASAQGTAEVGQSTCGCYLCVTDLSRGGSELGIDLPLPPGRTVGDLSQIESQICLDDDGRLRRISFTDRFTSMALEVVAFDCPPAVSWAHLPVFDTSAD